MTASNFLRMRPFTKTLITIVLVSVPACLLVLALAARTQDSLPLNARYEDSTSGLILLTFCFCTALVLMVRLVGTVRRNRIKRATHRRELQAPKGTDFESRLRAFAGSANSEDPSKPSLPADDDSAFGVSRPTQAW